MAAEKAAGRGEGGTVDLIWLNGENFAAMKEQGLLYGPFTQLLPSFALVDTAGQPTTLVDFTVPTDGLESPWGMAKFVLFHDTARACPSRPPRSTRCSPGPRPIPAGSPTPPRPTSSARPSSSTCSTPPSPIPRGCSSRSTADGVRRPDRRACGSGSTGCGPHLWRGGEAYPATGQALHQLLDDGEVDFSMAFNPAEASSLILAGRLPETVRSFVFADGTIANTHFVAIPFNAAHREGAIVAAEFLLSPEAQARKQDVAVWGDPTVLDLRPPGAGRPGAVRRPAPRAGDAAARSAGRGAGRAAPVAGWCCSSGAGPSATAAEPLTPPAARWRRRSPSPCFWARWRAGSPAPSCRRWPASPGAAAGSSRGSRAASLLTLGSGLGATLLALAGGDR